MDKDAEINAKQIEQIIIEFSQSEEAAAFVEEVYEFLISKFDDEEPLSKDVSQIFDVVDLNKDKSRIN
ncbi:hypothetical protein ACSVDA_14225 [Cytobacillus sp. Hm23]